MKNSKNIGVFLSKKIIRLITLLVALCIVTFVLMELSPIDPVTAPVLEVIGQKFKASLYLMMIAWVISGVLGFVMGIISGTNENKVIDKIIRGYCYIVISTPTFWLGILFIMVFSVSLGWFPVALGVPIGVSSADVTFMDLVSHIILPAFTLSLIGVSNICLHTREKVIEVMNSEK